jgi:hypothetical protein
VYYVQELFYLPKHIHSLLPIGIVRRVVHFLKLSSSNPREQLALPTGVPRRFLIFSRSALEQHFKMGNDNFFSSPLLIHVHLVVSHYTVYTLIWCHSDVSLNDQTSLFSQSYSRFPLLPNAAR